MRHGSDFYTLCESPDPNLVGVRAVFGVRNLSDGATDRRGIDTGVSSTSIELRPCNLSFVPACSNSALLRSYAKSWPSVHLGAASTITKHIASFVLLLSTSIIADNCTVDLEMEVDMEP
jgi:hypothetical protein